MSAPIGPGDWVEAVRRPGEDGPPRAGFVVGAIYLVERVVHEGRHTGLVIADMPRSGGHPSGAWSTESFRPIYRPKSEIIERLKQPAPPVARELVHSD